MGLFKRSYFIRSKTGCSDGTHNENWTVITLGFWDVDIVTKVNQYRHDLENAHGGICMITELRRI